ncbi:MAG TPA: neutral zinc metallopeptidase [Steroidobacteraceae bacterium]|jgi:predicted metalloprotease|nr:neutral zinc metallopeptidase [Steroidobacteraceae bacterium]
MRWQGNRESDNVEDRRGESGGFGGIHLGIGGTVLVLLGAWLFGYNPLTILSLLTGEGSSSPQVADVPPPGQPSPQGADPLRHFVGTILASTEDVWSVIFAQSGRRYQPPHLVLFSNAIQTGCGGGQSAMGPFYCPQDQRVYIDLAFYRTLRTRLGSPGDSAQAYVIAHEVGHHVQYLTGITNKVDALRARENRVQTNATSVRVELQADCYAGVWAFHSQDQKHWFEDNEIGMVLNAASHIGDDALQKMEQGRVMPETFTHGTSQQRVNWFKRGYASGRVEDCDTFNAATL